MRYQEIIRALQLTPLDAEGGWYRRVYSGPMMNEDRPVATCIHALFTEVQFSALHRLDADEQFFFHDGDPMEVFQIDANGRGEWSELGRVLAAGQRMHQVFRKGTWFGARPKPNEPNGWSLISAVVTPGFEWSGFELAERHALLVAYPEHKEAIIQLTRVS